MSARWAFGHLIVAPPSYIDVGFFLLLVFKTQAESHHSWERVCAPDIWVTQGPTQIFEEHFRGDRTSYRGWKARIKLEVRCLVSEAKQGVNFLQKPMLLRAGFSLLVVSTRTVVGPLRQKNCHSHSSTKSHFHLSDGLGSNKDLKDIFHWDAMGLSR